MPVLREEKVLRSVRHRSASVSTGLDFQIFAARQIPEKSVGSLTKVEKWKKKKKKISKFDMLGTDSGR